MGNGFLLPTLSLNMISNNLMKLKYHQKTSHYLKKEPVISEEALEQLAAAEKRCGLTFPASVREWCSIKDAMKFLQYFQNDDSSFLKRSPFEDIEVIGEKWHDKEGDDVAIDLDDSDQDWGQDFLVIMHEYEIGSRYAVKLDGSDEPPVFLDRDSAPQIIWQYYANSFSEFIYHCFWYWNMALTKKTFQFRAHTDQRLNQHDFAFLEQHFKQENRITPTYSTKVVYRFSQADQQIIVGLEDKNTHWELSANSPSSLFELADQVWHCNGLSAALTVIDHQSAKAADVSAVLNELKEKTRSISPDFNLMPSLKERVVTEDSPRLYTRGTREEFMRYFGQPISEFYDNQFVIVANTVLVFLCVQPTHPGFGTGFASPSEVYWATQYLYPSSYSLAEDGILFLLPLVGRKGISHPFVQRFPDCPLLQVPLVGTKETPAPVIELFVKKERQSYIYLGQAQAISSHYIAEQNFGDIIFSLKQPLPTSIFDALGGYHGARVLIENQHYTFPDVIVPSEIAKAIEPFKNAHIEANCWEGHELFMLINEKQATLLHRCSSCEATPSFNFAYQGAANTVSEFCSEHWPPIKVPTSHVISRQEGIAALVEFLKTGCRPKSIVWWENRPDNCYDINYFEGVVEEDVPF
ncbi:MAG: hypothetical protein DRR16_30955 [Candidatus Parabeggiatoa sp. nov. 3]|nr:MAG: hypothetical protein DRR00_10245 [Gammaproteobacteria bacterium]RKZ63824.1 MAG: hypothetical protein DRQ99_16420 [Gammaproteobacteria bacterium]RKZ75778.1 MAG: hypothetical protein DRR16_30955 [Gammaproteobacteria bacterium]